MVQRRRVHRHAHLEPAHGAAGRCSAAGGESVRIGFLGYSSGSIPEPFREGLRKIGYVEGQNMASPENRRSWSK